MGTIPFSTSHKPTYLELVQNPLNLIRMPRLDRIGEGREREEKAGMESGRIVTCAGGVFDVGDVGALRLFGCGLEHFDWSSWLLCWNALEMCCSLLMRPSDLINTRLFVDNLPAQEHGQLHSSAVWDNISTPYASFSFSFCPSPSTLSSPEGPRLKNQY
jgi:hypothetical protein